MEIVLVELASSALHYRPYVLGRAGLRGFSASTLHLSYEEIENAGPSSQSYELYLDSECNLTI